MRLIPVLLFLIISTTSFGISKTDSLRNELAKHPDDTGRIRILTSLAFKLYSSDTEESLKLVREAIQLSEKLNYDDQLSNAWNVVAVCFYMRADYEKSLQSFHKSLAYAEKQGKETSDIINNIGLIYWAMNNTDLAFEYYSKALAGYKKKNSKDNIALAWGNFANIYKVRKSYDTALIYIDSAINVFQNINDRASLGNQFNNKGNIYLELGDTNNDIVYYEKSLTEKQISGNIIGIANTSYNLGKILIGMKDIKKAGYYTILALDTAKKYGFRETIAGCYNNLAFIERAMGNFKKAFEYYTMFVVLHDSIFSEGLNKEIAQMKTLYETEKKEQTILKQSAELGKEKAENEARKLQQKQERLILAGAGIVILLLVVLAVFIFRSYSQKKRANIVLRQQKNEIIQQKEEITCQRDEIEAQRDEITGQRDQISDRKSVV